MLIVVAYGSLLFRTCVFDLQKVARNSDRCPNDDHWAPSSYWRCSSLLTLFQVVHQQHSLYVPETGGHHLACRLHWFGFLWNQRLWVFPLFWLFFSLWLENGGPKSPLIAGEIRFKHGKLLTFCQIPQRVELHAHWMKHALLISIYLRPRTYHSPLL